MVIQPNKNNLKAMLAETKTTLLHVASSKENNLHYSHCPTGSDSWCKHNKNRANSTTYKPSPDLLI